MYACVYICTCLYVCVCKITTESIYCCLHVHMFRAEHLGLDTLPWSLSLKKTDIFFPLSLPVALYLEVGLHKMSPIHLGMSAGAVIMQVLFRKHIAVTSVSCLEVTILQQVSLSSGSFNLSPPLL